MDPTKRFAHFDSGYGIPKILTHNLFVLEKRFGRALSA